MEEAVSTALGHLSNTEREIIRISLFDGGSVVTWTIEDLSTADVSYQHLFELKDYRPITYPVQRMPENYNQTVKTEVENILRARDTKPARTPWAFLVVIARKKDSQPRFCIDYRVFNKRMKVDKLLIPNLEEFLEDMAGANVFIKVDTFAGYWKLKLAEHVQEITDFTCKYGPFQF